MTTTSQLSACGVCFLSSCLYTEVGACVRPGGGYLVQKTLRGCAANMGSKISLLVYEWPLIRCKIWYMNGTIFKIWPNLSQNWLKFKKILEKIGNFVQNLAQNRADWYMNGLLFLEKLVFVWVYFQIPWRHIPTKTKLEYPPGMWDTVLIFLVVPASLHIILANPELCHVLLFKPTNDVYKCGTNLQCKGYGYRK